MNATSAGRGAASTRVDYQSRTQRPSTPTVAILMRRYGGWLVLEIDGEMDLQVAPFIAAVVDANTTHVAFDLHGVTFMDSYGLETIVETQNAAVAAGGGVCLIAPSGHARRLLTLAGSAPRVLPRYDSLDEAMTAPRS